jgi:hypothetical protein
MYGFSALHAEKPYIKIAAADKDDVAVNMDTGDVWGLAGHCTLGARTCQRGGQPAEEVRFC